MKGKSQQVLEFLYKNSGAYTNEEILRNINLENKSDKISKTLYDMRRKRGFIILVGEDKYKITDRGRNHAAINYGMSKIDIISTNIFPYIKKTKPAKLKQVVARTNRKDNLPIKKPLLIGNSIILSEKLKKEVTLEPSIKGDLEKALKLEIKGNLQIKDLDQKLEILGVISKLVDDKLSYWVDEVIKDLKG